MFYYILIYFRFLIVTGKHSLKLELKVNALRV